MQLSERFERDARVRAAFCSEANFSHWANPRGAQLEVSRIMYPSPESPHLGAIGGIFHARNRFYLQVIEGPVESVEWYLTRVENDPRHKNFKLICVEPIEGRRFETGGLRPVGDREQINMLGRAHGLEAFNPYRYTPEMIANFVGLARQADGQESPA